MKKILFFFALTFLFSCSDESEEEASTNSSYRDDMRNFVIGISAKAKAIRPGFSVIPQNGIELVSVNGEEDGELATAYLNAIDGHGQEDLFFGYNEDNVATPTVENLYLSEFLDRSKSGGKTILVTDYCSSPDKISSSNSQNSAKGYISFAATERELNVIPTTIPANVNSANVTTLSQAKNFLYLINSENYASKTDFVNAVKATNYDAIIMDLFYQNETFTAAEVESMRVKANGGTRLLICYMSIGEAEDYRYYWNSLWNTNKPEWIASENPSWPGNYKVQYWNAEWQNLIYKDDYSYLDKILNVGFDGIYLDIIDAFEYFEQ